MRRSSIVSLLLVVLAAVPLGADCLFVNQAGISENRLGAFRVGADPILTPAPGSPYTTGGVGGFGSIQMASFGSWLYVADSGIDSRADGSIAGFTIHGDCSLEPLPGSPWPAGRELQGMVVQRRQRLLYLSSFRDGTIARFQIEADGSLAPAGSSWIGPAEGPADLALAPGQRILYVAHFVSGSVGAYEIRNDGALQPVTGSPFAQPAMFLGGLTLSPNGRFLYAVDGRNSNIHGFRTRGDGRLTPIPGSPWRTTPLFGGTGPRDAQLSADGRYLFVANHDRHTIGVYAVRPSSGALQEAPGSPFPSSTRGPWALTVSSDGDLLFAIQRGGLSPCGVNCLAAYLLDGATPLADPAGPLSVSPGVSTGLFYYEAPRGRR